MLAEKPLHMHSRCADPQCSITSRSVSPELLLLPEHVLQQILLKTAIEGAFRHVCKAFSVAIAKATLTVKLTRAVLRNRTETLRALSTFPNASRVILDLSADRQAASGAGAAFLADAEEDTSLIGAALDVLAATRHPLTSLVLLHLSGSVPLPSAATLSHLTSCGLNELEWRDVSIQRAAHEGTSNLMRSSFRPVPPPAPELSGPVRPGTTAPSFADSIRCRGAAMIRLARALPALRRLSLCSAAFSAGDVASLRVLTQLQELSLVGAMECGGGPAGRLPVVSSAAAVYQGLLAALPGLHKLQLPMAMVAPALHGFVRANSLYDSSDEDDDEDDADDDEWDGLQEDYWGFIDANSSSDGLSSNGSSDDGRGSRSFIPLAALPVEKGRGAVASTAGLSKSMSSGWVFPPSLEDLTIPLCALNGPVFRAVCDAYGSDAKTGIGRYGSSGAGIGISNPIILLDEGCGGRGSDDGGEGVGAAARGLRALHVTCAPGYTLWEGTFLSAEQDFEALSRLTSLESLHLSLELDGCGRGSLRRDSLRGCFQHLKALHRIRDLRVSETRQPLCFSTRKSNGGAATLLSYVVRNSVPAPPPPPQADALGGQFVNGRAVNGPLLAQPPLSAPPPPRPSAAALNDLLAHWPQLQTLVFSEQSVVRTSHGGQDRLVLPGSLDELLELQDEQRASLW